MYDLFVLGELADQPMHGYLLHTILSHVLGPMRPISWGSLYAVLKRLEDSGDIMQMESHGPSTGRSKKVYALTDQGRQHFLRLMSRPLEHNVETEDIFRVKLSKFHLVSGVIREQILLEYKVFVDLLIESLDLAEEHVNKDESISAEERPYILLTVEHDRVAYEARRIWLEQQFDSYKETRD